MPIRTLILTTLIVLSAGQTYLQAQTRDIWLCPQASIPPSPLNRAVDFMQLFTPDATWKKAAEHTRVFKLYGSFVNPARQGQIDTIVADLKRRGIAIGLETGTIDVNFKNPVPPCGGLGLVEGYGTPAQAANICAKIKKAGGRIDFLCMDEPLYYGHYFTKRAGKSQPGCQSPVDTILRLMIPTLNVYRQAFPDIVVGEVEPTEIAAFPGWQQVLSDWTAGFRALNGRPLAFMQLDIPWANRAPSVEPADAVAYFHFCETLRERHLLDKIGIIYDGTPLDTTDAAWMQDARNHLVELSDRYQLHPDMAIFQSWMPHPTHAMPDSDPNTLSSIVEFYVQRANRR